MRASKFRTNSGKPIFATSALAAVLLVASAAYAKDPQLVPRRLSSTGDSISAAVDAEYYGPNPNASWVNGYYGFWEWMSGYTDVASHNERVTSNWGAKGRTNNMDAGPGTTMADLADQTAQAVSQTAQYVTVFMGSNDICKNHAYEIPTDAEFEANFRAGMETLKKGLPHGATVYVLAIPNIRHLYDVGMEKADLGIMDCPAHWSNRLPDHYPCVTMLGSGNTEADRQYTLSRIIAFNNILEEVTSEYQRNDWHHYYFFSDVTFTYQFPESDVSNLDCFHPSAQGQANVARITWISGPFRAYQKAPKTGGTRSR